ncbi:MAG: tRNA glutamyl-Q(34) synthetase GluQRS [Planctomycetota bacterium]|nr:MAG: tRNA glutamyl-Q(34) synthetase GluQRS [Planctomycetota bacterium]
MDPETSPAAIVGRLAPSPTGALHVGNARSLLLAWLSVRQRGGRLWLRIEDIDSPRVKPWAVQQTLEDLQWLGLDWDSFSEKQLDAGGRPRVSGLPGVAVQTERTERYREVLQRLIDGAAVYPCTCSRSDIAAAASAPHESPHLPALEGTVYPGTCRLGDSIRSSDAAFAWRFLTPPTSVSWTDGVRGVQTARVDVQLGDFVVARSDGTPAYQLAVVIDDYDMGVNEIVRGDDLIPSTFRQLVLQQHLGWPAPAYYHVPLMVGPDGRRLAKRHGDTRVAFLRDAGVTPAALIGYLAWTLGLVPDREPRSPASLIGCLDWGRIPTSPTVFDLSRELPLLQESSR